jgi:hypothetical protein
LLASDINSIQVVGPGGAVLQAVFASLGSGSTATNPPANNPPAGGVAKGEAGLRGSVDPMAGTVTGEAQAG